MCSAATAALRVNVELWKLVMVGASVNVRLWEKLICGINSNECGLPIVLVGGAVDAG